MTSPNTAEVWADHSFWPQDPQFELALAGGVTTMQLLPGSANLFGGRGVTVKNVPSRTAEGMKFPGAPHGLKMACGENPKRVYGSATRRRQPRWATWRAFAGPGWRPPTTATSGRRGATKDRIRRSVRNAICRRRRWPASSTARFSSTTTATAATRWRR